MIENDFDVIGLDAQTAHAHLIPIVDPGSPYIRLGIIHAVFSYHYSTGNFETTLSKDLSGKQI